MIFHSVKGRKKFKLRNSENKGRKKLLQKDVEKQKYAIKTGPEKIHARWKRLN